MFQNKIHIHVILQTTVCCKNMIYRNEGLQFELAISRFKNFTQRRNWIIHGHQSGTSDLRAMRTDWTELVHCHEFGTPDLRAMRNYHCDYVYVRNAMFTHFVCDLACFELQLLQFWPGSAILRTGCCVRRHLGANWKNKKLKAFSKTLTISIKISSRRPTMPSAKSYSIHLTTFGVVHFKLNTRLYIFLLLSQPP